MIPEKALEAAKDAVARDLLARRAAIVDDQHIALILEAAAPFIAAQVLRNLADSAEKRSPDDGVSPHWIRRVANVVQESAE